MPSRRISAIVLAILLVCSGFRVGFAQSVPIPTGAQLDQLVAPVALYPDPLLAQICAASTDPQQILDVNNWLLLNRNLQGQALTDAAQNAGFDPAFVSLVNFPEVLGMMAAHIDDFAALGAAFQANQAAVMDSVQRLRQKAFSTGALDSNEYQNVAVQNQGGTQVVVVQPANPQIVFVPQYDPVTVFAAPSTGDVFAASLVSFGAGIALGAWMNNSYPWGWGGWGWGWGGGRMMWRGNPWAFRPIYRPPRAYFRPRPPMFNRPINVRPPNNWAQRPGFRPPPSGWRPSGPLNPNRPGGGNNAGGRPPSGGNNRPGQGTGNTRPPNQGGGNNRPGQGTGNARPPNQGGGASPGQPGGNNRPGQGTGNARPPNQGGGTSPGQGGGRPGQGTGNARPPNQGGTSPGQGGGRPGQGGGNQPGQSGARPTQPTTRPAQPTTRPQQQTRPAQTSRPSNQFSGHQTSQQSSRPAQTGARQGAFSGSSNGGAARAASNQGRTSAGAPRGGGRR